MYYWSLAWRILSITLLACERSAIVAFDFSSSLLLSLTLQKKIEPQDWKRSVFIPIPKKGNAQKCSNYSTIALISHTSEVCPGLENLEHYFSSMWDECGCAVFEHSLALVLEKAERNLRIKLPTWNPWGCKELDMTPRLSLHFHTSWWLVANPLFFSLLIPFPHENILGG